MTGWDHKGRAEILSRGSTLLADCVRKKPLFRSCWKKRIQLLMMITESPDRIGATRRWFSNASAVRCFQHRTQIPARASLSGKFRTLLVSSKCYFFQFFSSAFAVLLYYMQEEEIFQVKYRNWINFNVTIHSQIKNGSRILQAKLVRSRLTVFIWLRVIAHTLTGCS